MSTIKIYGGNRTRASRPLWVLRELNLDVDQVQMMPPDAKDPDYMKVNPNGRLPTMVDGDLTLFESFAINLYLAKKYGHGGAQPLYPATLEGEALAWQWTLWVVNECEPLTTTMIVERFAKPEGHRNEALAAAAEEKLMAPLPVIDGVLAKRQYLATDYFSIADLNVAAVLHRAPALGVDLKPYPNLAAWLGRCTARPSYRP